MSDGWVNGGASEATCDLSGVKAGSKVEMCLLLAVLRLVDSLVKKKSIYIQYLFALFDVRLFFHCPF